jgi:hypothetical protein
MPASPGTVLQPAASTSVQTNVNTAGQPLTVVTTCGLGPQSRHATCPARPGGLPSLLAATPHCCVAKGDTAQRAHTHLHRARTHGSSCSYGCAPQAGFQQPGSHTLSQQPAAGTSSSTTRWCSVHLANASAHNLWGIASQDCSAAYCQPQGMGLWAQLLMLCTLCAPATDASAAGAPGSCCVPA